MTTPGATEALASIYADAEARLIAHIAKQLEAGLDAPDWAIRQLAEIGQLSAAARGILNSLNPIVQAAINQTVAEAAAAGIASADAEIAAAEGFHMTPPLVPAAGVVDVAAVAALAQETVSVVTAAHHAILRDTQDAYRRIIAETTGRTITGAQNRRQTLQQTLDRFAQSGLSGFTDRAGRRWRMDTYADMALRTSAFRAQTQGHADRLRERGHDLIVVSNHPRPAPECQPFEGKVLSLTGEVPPGRHRFDGVNGRAVTVHVVATVSEAERRGLHHPNCRHRYTLYVPGARIPEPEPYDEQGYHDEQKLRYLERQVRAAKRLEAAALDDDAAKAARARIRHYQARIRDHTAQTGVPRRRFREQLREGNAGNATAQTRVTTRTSAAEMQRRQDSDVTAWLDAEQRYRADVTSWLGAEQRYRDDVDSWLSAEQRYQTDVTAWLAAEDAAKVAAARAAADDARRGALAPHEFDRREGQRWASGHWPYSTSDNPFEQHQADAIWDYTNSGHEYVNPPLRQGRPMAPEHRDMARSLDEAIDRAPRVPEAVVVTRTIDDTGFGDIAPRDALSLNGQLFTDDGFMSTSVEASGDGVLVDSRQPYLMRLTVPEGTSGLYVSAGGDRALSAMGNGENELILGRGVTYRVEQVEMPEDLNDRSTPVVVHATIVSQEPRPL